MAKKAKAKKAEKKRGARYRAFKTTVVPSRGAGKWSIASTISLRLSSPTICRNFDRAESYLACCGGNSSFGGGSSVHDIKRPDVSDLVFEQW